MARFLSGEEEEDDRRERGRRDDFLDACWKESRAEIMMGLSVRSKGRNGGRMSVFTETMNQKVESSKQLHVQCCS